MQELWFYNETTSSNPLKCIVLVILSNGDYNKQHTKVNNINKGYNHVKQLEW